MAFETNNFEVAKKIALPKSEFSVECNLSAGENIGKILFVTVDAGEKSFEILNGIINYSGDIDIKLAYLNSHGEINVANAVCPFSSKFESENIQNGKSAIISVKVVDYNIENVTDNNVRISVMLMQTGFVFGNEQIETITSNSGDVCCKMEEVDIVKYIGVGQDVASIESEINIREKIKKILIVESRANIKSIESGVNFGVVNGEIISRILYLNENDKFESGYIFDSFKEEVELEGLNRDSFVEGKVCIKQDDITAQIIEDDKGQKVQIKSPVCISIFGYNNEKVSVVKDLYSTKCSTSVTTESFEMLKPNAMEMIEGKIEGTLLLDEDKPRVDKILFFGGNSVTLTNSYITDGEITVEGIARTNVIYLNDEDGLWHSVELDVPFTLSDKTNIDGDALLQVDITLSDVDVSVRKGRELLFDGKIKTNVSFAQNISSAVITSAQEEELYPEKDYSMEVVFAHAGEDIWEIAKASKVKEEQVLTQNPDVVFPLNEDSPLVLFYQKLK